MITEHLKLSNQFCFPVYTLSRLITKLYKPFLDKLGLTYPQFLVMMVLWEQDNICVKDISEKLLLESNTLTPLLKRMETNGLLKRTRSNRDERIVILKLTEKGDTLIDTASKIENPLTAHFKNQNISEKDLIKIKDTFCEWIEQMTNKE